MSRDEQTFEFNLERNIHRMLDKILEDNDKSVDEDKCSLITQDYSEILEDDFSYQELRNPEFSRQPKKLTTVKESTTPGLKALETRRIAPLISQIGKQKSASLVTSGISNRFKCPIYDDCSSTVSQRNDRIETYPELFLRTFSNLDKLSYIHFLTFKGNFSSIIIDYHGSRILQKLLAKTEKYIIGELFDDIKIYLPRILIDTYGNYFCQKFYSYLEINQKINFLYVLKNNLSNISSTQIGTYSIQAIIEQMLTEKERTVFAELLLNDYNYMKMCLDRNAVHVIEKVITCYTQKSIQFIYDFVLVNFLNMAVNSTGLCVLKKVISHCSEVQTIGMLQKLICQNFNLLVENVYGNNCIIAALTVNIIFNYLGLD